MQVPKLFKQAKQALENGEIILIQTDTVIGLAADAENTEAILRINRIKGTEADRVRQLIFSDLDQLAAVASLTPQTIKVLNRFLPGPYTFIIRAKNSYPFSKLTVKNGKIAARIPKAPTLLKFIKYYGKPLAATSANFTGKPPTVHISEVDPEIKKHTALFLEEPKLQTILKHAIKNPQGGYYASGIIDLTTKPPKELRYHPANQKLLLQLKTLL